MLNQGMLDFILKNQAKVHLRSHMIKVQTYIYIFQTIPKL